MFDFRKMIRLFFYAALVAGTIASPITINARDGETIECYKNQDLFEYFNIPIIDIKWTYVKTNADVEPALNDDNNMIVVDVSYDENIKENIISEDLNLKDFLNNLLQSIKDGKKHGVKYNIKSKKAFENFKYKYEPKLRSELPPFPQWFHLNVAKAGDQIDDSIIPFKDISKHYKENEILFNCYTFSFGWGANDKCVTGDVNDIIEQAKNFNMERKNLVIDMANNPGLTTEVKGAFKTFTFVMDEKNGKCASPKTLSADLEEIKTIYDGQLLMDNGIKPSYFEIHEKLCQKITGFLSAFTEENDLTETKWKSVSQLTQLDAEISEDIIRVDIDKAKLESMFLGKNFEDFISKLKESNEGKPLQLNFKNQAAIDSYWNIEHSAIDTISEIPISIKVDVDQFNYNSNKWIDCYTPAFSIEKNPSKAYSDDELEILQTTADKVNSDEKIYAFDMIRVSKTEKVKILKLVNEEKHALVLNSDEDTVENVKNIRDILVDAMSKTFVDVNEKMTQKIDSVVTMNEIYSDIEDDLTLLEFVTVSDLDQLKDALKTPKRMIQVGADNVKTIKDYFNEMRKLNDNGIKLHFESKEMFKNTLSLLKYRNFPIWIQLDVNKIIVNELISELKSLHHHLVLGSKQSINVDKMETAREAISDIDVTISLRAKEYNENKAKIDVDVLHTSDNLLIWMEDTDNVIAKELRANLNDKDYYLDVPKKFIMKECAVNQKINDFSNLKISNYVKNVADVETYLDTFNMIRARIVMCGKDICVHNENFNLNDFLEAFKSHTSDKEKGIIFTFGTTDIFRGAMVEEMKTFNYPIWLDVNVFKAGTSDQIVDLDYENNNDIIDCRTLLLGLDTSEPDFNGYEKDDIKNLKCDYCDESLFTIRADFIETSWDSVKENKIISQLPNTPKTFISKKYREFIAGKTNIVSDFPGNEEKLLDCPSKHDVESFFMIENDLSAMLMSDYVKDEEDLIKKIDEESIHMIRAKIDKGETDLFIGKSDFTLTKFLETFKMHSEDKKKGIIFTFDNDDTFSKAMVKEMKTLDYPIWFEFEAVDGTSSHTRTSRILTLDHDKDNDIIDCRTMLLTTKIDDDFVKYEPDHITKLKTFPFGVKNKFSFRAEYLVESRNVLENLLDDKRIFLYMPDDSDIKFNTKDVREELKGKKEKMFVDFQGSNKHAMDECPTNNDFITYFSNVDGLEDDLSLLIISDPIKSIEDAKNAITNKKQHIISVTVTLNEDGVLIVNDDLTLKDLLEAAEGMSADTRFGAKIKFTTQNAYEAVFKDPAILNLIRNMERPIWINVLVIGDKDTVDLKYEDYNDLLDCRTLSLGWSGDVNSKYTPKSIKEMKDLPIGNNQKIYFVELLHINHIWDLVKELVTGEGNKNKLTLVSVADDAEKVDYASMEDILTDYKNILLFDFPDVVRKSLNGGCGSLTSNLLFASLLAFIVMILQ